jgi:serine/threonine protein kinase
VLASHREGDGLEVLKALREDRASDAQAVARFSREVDLAVRLRAPGLLPVRRVRRSSGVLVLVMPCVLGPDAWTFLVECERRGHAPSLQALLPPALQVAEALAAMHRGDAGLPPCAHGDLSAGNVLLSMTGRCHLVDYGSVTMVEDDPRAPRRDLQQLGLLLAAMRAGRLPGGSPPPPPSDTTLNIAVPDEERAFDLLVSRCIHSGEQGGFDEVEEFAEGLHALIGPGVLEQARSALAAELEQLFGKPHRGRAFGTGFYRPPMIPMLLSWLPPVPRSAAVDRHQPARRLDPGPAAPEPPPEVITQPTRAIPTHPGEHRRRIEGDPAVEVIRQVEVPEDAAATEEIPSRASRFAAATRSRPDPTPPESANTTKIPGPIPPDAQATEEIVRPSTRPAPAVKSRASRLELVVILVASTAFIAGALLAGAFLLLGGN